LLCRQKYANADKSLYCRQKYVNAVKSLYFYFSVMCSFLATLTVFYQLIDIRCSEKTMLDRLAWGITYS